MISRFFHCFRGPLILALAALIWGTSFVSQSVGMKSVEAFTFNGVRTLLGALTLLPVVALRRFFLRKRGGDPSDPREKPGYRKKLLTGGVCCGLVLCVATNVQQFAFNDPDSSSGKIAFLTAMYMVLVPVLSFFVFKKRPSVLVALGVVTGVCGVYLLSVKEGFSMGYGDILSLLCAFCFSVHILVIDRFAPSLDGVELSCVQFAVSGGVTCLLMFLFETPTPGAVASAALPILYSGLMSCGVAYTLQVVGQKKTDPTVASLIMCLESVFGALSGWIILGETMSLRAIFGCVLMFIAILLTQIPPEKVFRLSKQGK